MAGFNNALSNIILDIAAFGTSSPGSTTQAAITPSISAGPITTGLLINPVYTPSSGTLFGERINPQFKPQSGFQFASVYGLSIAPLITPTGGLVTNAYGLTISGPSAIAGSIGTACSLYITNSGSAGSILNNYTAILGAASNALVGVGTATPAYSLDINGILSVHRIYRAGTMMDNQLINLAEGTDQGSFGGGSAGTNKRLSLNTTAFYDLTQGSTQPLGGFCGGVFDGRYIYFVPYRFSNNSFGTVVRYDTALPFAAAGSFTTFDLTQLSSLAKGFWGGLFDGRYVYFAPFTNPVSNTFFIQYDTTRSFTQGASYTLFNLTAITVAAASYAGGAFDGRYIYLAPSTYINNTTIVRYDTTLSFTVAASYSTFNTATIDASRTSYFDALFDGRYVYFAPNQASSGYSGSILQYDTTLPFSAPGSYAAFNLTSVATSGRGFQGGMFDGRYIYLIPNTTATPPLLARYDTMQPFTAAGSYTTFNLLLIDPSNNLQQAGGVFDGRYIYFAHDESNVAGSTIIRFDTTLSFNSTGSYTCFRVGQGIAFKGAVYDGRYVYFVPCDTGAISSGTIVRLDAYPGPPATAMAASRAPNGFAVGSYAGVLQPPANGMIVNNTIGINNPNPQYNVDVGGTIHAASVTSSNLTITPGYSSNVYATGGTTRQQLVTLAEGYDQGGFGGGSVGTNKTLTLNTAALFNVSAGTNNPLALPGFAGAVFDGRYIYFVPYFNGGYQGTIVRYDTTLSFVSSGSFSTFDIAQVIGVASVGHGFFGGLYDGRYVYYIPLGVGTAPQLVQYDTTLAFNTVNSYASFDLTTIGTGIVGYAGGIFDGRYIYLAPGALNTNSPISTTIVRYDTALSFNAQASYSTFNTMAIDSSLTTYSGAVFDGRYVYFVPYVASVKTTSGSTTRYDTTLPFGAPGSYTIFNLASVSTSCKGFQGGVFDGRYVYFITAGGLAGAFSLTLPPLLTRYDTMQPFRSAGSYTTFNLYLVDPTNSGEMDGVFDGRYIYFGHGELPASPSWGGTIIRFDTAQPFNSPGSYTCIGVANPLRYRGAAYDGHYVYFVPGNGTFSGGTIIRLDAYPGPQAGAIAASQAPSGFAIGTYAGVNAPPANSLIVGGRIGINTASPQYGVDIVGTLNAKNIIAPNLSLGQLYATAGTSGNQSIVLSEGYNQGGFGSGSVGTNITMNASTILTFDTSLISSTPNQYFGGVFDGRYIYLSPGQGSPDSSSVIRYDTTLPFSSTGSYTAFNLLQLSSNCKGFIGALFDGRYVYFLPNTTNLLTQYDTYQNFNQIGSYAIFDLSGFVTGTSFCLKGGVFDGRYVYLPPYQNNRTVARYDTTLPFSAASSYQATPLSSSYGTTAQLYSGGTFDGRYVYFSPYAEPFGQGCFIARYDTTLPFNNLSSFTSFDLTPFFTDYCTGSGFDGRYVYVLSTNGTVVRYDTQQNFNSYQSYAAINLRSIIASNTTLKGVTFDGRYVYFSAEVNQVARYDTTQSFQSLSSYSTLALTSTTFRGLILDGQHAYVIPYGGNTILTRIGAYPGPQATALATNQAPNGFMVGAYAGSGLANNTANSNALVIGGNVGINTAIPQFTLDVSGTIDATNWAVSGAIYGLTGLLTNSEYVTLSEGYNQGGLGGGSVGTNRSIAAAWATVFDMTTVNTGDAGFQGGVFDGRYLYLVPNNSGLVVQFDTTLTFNSANSYAMFNTADSGVLDALSTGFAGGLFDGRYVYFIPLLYQQIGRYDTTLPFSAASSYTLFNLTTVSRGIPGYAGGVFDGRYLYLASNLDTNGVPSGTITRYDTTLSFNTKTSYTCFNTVSLGAGVAGYFGAVYDGRYVYFVPGTPLAGTVSQYDTALSFTATGSWTLFDLTRLQKGCRGYNGAVFDGRYIYFAPYSSAGAIFGTIVRYDTTQSFSFTGSYALFDMTSMTPGCAGYAGAVYDGRYVYFSPAAPASGTVVCFDTTLPFNAISSFTTLDLSVFGSCRGYVGCMFDGQYVYFVPYNNGAMSGLLARIGACPGPQATAIAASQAPNGFAVGTYAGSGLGNSSPALGLSYYNALIVSGNVGIGIATPTYSLQLATDSAGKPSTNTWTINSDVRIKRNIQDIPGALSTVCQLRPRKFTWHPDYAKDISADPNAVRFGFVADEVEGVLEGCVSPSSIHCHGGKMREWLDRGACGPMPEPLPGLSNLKSFNMHNILIFAIQAVRELADIEESLRRAIGELSMNK